MMIYELILVVCMQPGHVECATFRQQMNQAECISEVRRFENRYGYDEDTPPYIEMVGCTATGYEEN